MNTCRDFQLELAAYRSGELDPQTTRAVQRHLDQCPSCRSELATEDALAARITAQFETPAPAQLLPRILASSQNHSSRKPRWQPFLRGAAMGLAAMLAVLVFRPGPSHIPPLANTAGSPVGSSRVYTAADIKTARRDLAWTLTTTGRVLDRTSKEVIGEVFGRRLPHAISTSLHQALTTNPKGRS